MLFQENKLKVLITTDLYTVTTNGVVTSVQNLFDELTANGHDVRILTISGDLHSHKEGAVYYADVKCPEGFCHTAWNCIYQYVFALANGGGKEGFFYDDWTREPGIAISSCNDGFRPVIFKLEATDIPSEK